MGKDTEVTDQIENTEKIACKRDRFAGHMRDLLCGICLPGALGVLRMS